MMLSTKGRYAVMAILDMATQDMQKPTSLAEIATRQNIALNYLEQIFAKLRKAGLVNAIKGPGGGYVISVELNQLTIAAIIDAVEENIEMTRCKINSYSGCMPDHVKCKTHDLWHGLSEHIRSYFTAISVADIL